MIIADTNIASEFMKDSPHHGVFSWARTLELADLAISVITVEEIERRLGRLPQGRRRSDLERRWHGFLDAYRDTIAAYDLNAAQATTHLVVDALDRGRPITHRGNPPERTRRGAVPRSARKTRRAHVCPELPG
ncbi:MAG: hypothetical protein Q4B08_09805, partial [Propionibacteriaceae bacterium]|nr:hypothetical protein [Propionibacteriaceae bacterium]